MLKNKAFLVTIGLILLFVFLGITGYLSSKKSIPPSLNSMVTSGKVTVPVPSASSTTTVSTATKQPNHQISVSIAITATANGHIRGNVELANSSKDSLASLYPEISLFTPSVILHTTVNGQAENKVTKDVVSYIQLGPVQLESGGQKTMPFDIPYSSHLKSGTYSLQVVIADKLARSFGMGFANLPLKGTGDLVGVDSSSCKVIVNNTAFDPQVAPPVKKMDTALGRCTLTNTQSKPLTLGYKISYAELHYYYYPQSQKLSQLSSERITLNPGEQKVFSFPLPTNLPPQVYDSYISLVDSNSQLQSIPMQFRFTIEGPSGRIEEISLDKNYYQEGDQATIKVKADPSMDLFWRNNQNYPIPSGFSTGTILKRSQLSVILTDKDNTQCGSGVYRLGPSPVGGAGWPEATISIYIKRNCINPKAEVKLSDSGNLLAEASIALLSPAGVSNDTVSNNRPGRNPLPIVIASLAVLAILLYFLFKNHGKNSGKFLGFLFVIGITILLLYKKDPSSASAFSYYSGNRLGGTITEGLVNWNGYVWAQQTDGQTDFNISLSRSGNSVGVTLSGTFLAPGCSNSVSHLIVDGPGLPSHTEVGSSGTGGPWSYSYTINNPPGTITFDYVLYVAYIHFGSDQLYTSCGPGNNDGGFCNVASGQNYNFPNDCGSNSCPYPEYGEQSFSSCVAGYGGPCNRVSCGGTGVILCDGSCSAPAPVCDTTPPSVSITNPPADTCYKGPTGSNGTPWSNTQPILVRVDDTHNSQGTSVISSGISNVSIKVFNLANNTTTDTITGSLSSGSTTNGTYSITIPQDSTTFPTNGGRYSITAYASDNASHTSNSAAYSFTYDATGNACTPPHIQTQNGDVHSQQNIGQ